MRVSSTARRPRRTSCAAGSSSTSAKRRISPWPRAGGAPQQRAQPREQLLERERLDQVVVGAGVEPADAVGHRVARGEDEHRRAVAGGAQPAAHLEPVHVRHQHVEHQRIRRADRQRVERLGAVGGQLGLVALQPQRAVDGVAHRRLVVDHEDAHAPACLGS